MIRVEVAELIAVGAANVIGLGVAELIAGIGPTIGSGEVEIRTYVAGEHDRLDSITRKTDGVVEYTYTGFVYDRSRRLTGSASLRGCQRVHLHGGEGRDTRKSGRDARHELAVPQADYSARGDARRLQDAADEDDQPLRRHRARGVG